LARSSFSERGSLKVKVRLRPITAELFAPFGALHERAALGQRASLEQFMANGRPQATLRVSTNAKAPVQAPYAVPQLERHVHSTQTFIPVDVGRWVVIVAPYASDGGPDSSRCLGFLMRGDQGVTYGMRTWHAPLAVLDQTGRFVSIIWRDDTAEDEEFVTLPEALEVGLD
jgi:ureidoglycolate lyase